MSTKLEEKWLILYERKILRKIYGPKGNKEENTYKRKINA